MKMMQLLIEEAMERATQELASMLGLVSESFRQGANRARALTTGGHIVDPAATCLFHEAEDLLLSTQPNLVKALEALAIAAIREPVAYAQTHAGLRALLDQAVEDAVVAELEQHAIQDDPAQPRPR